MANVNGYLSHGGVLGTTMNDYELETQEYGLDGNAIGSPMPFATFPAGNISSSLTMTVTAARSAAYESSGPTMTNLTQRLVQVCP